MATTRRYEFGMNESSRPDSIRAAIAEFISTCIFVFVGEGSVLALSLYHIYPHTQNLYYTSLITCILLYIHDYESICI